MNKEITKEDYYKDIDNLLIKIRACVFKLSFSIATVAGTEKFKEVKNDIFKRLDSVISLAEGFKETTDNYYTEDGIPKNIKIN